MTVAQQAGSHPSPSRRPTVRHSITMAIPTPMSTTPQTVDRLNAHVSASMSAATTAPIKTADR
jgi:hypothetical protein